MIWVASDLICFNLISKASEDWATVLALFCYINKKIKHKKRGWVEFGTVRVRVVCNVVTFLLVIVLAPALFEVRVVFGSLNVTFVYKFIDNLAMCIHFTTFS